MTKKEAGENFERFLACMRSQVVYLTNGNSLATHPDIYRFQAELVNDKYIDKGSAFSLSDEYFADLNKYGLLFMGQKPSFNNTGRVGWFVIKVEDGEKCSK